MASIASSQVFVMSFFYQLPDCWTQRDTSVNTAAIAAQGSYRLCREANMRDLLVQAF
jgi:hypothetical protein